MPDIQQLLLFIAASWLLNLTLGPDVRYIVTNSVRSGTKAGVISGLGITAGCFVHVSAAALGVSALLAASATAFAVLKYLGAAYLLWLGIRIFATKKSPIPMAAAAAPARDLKSAFMGGFFTNLLNPKVAIFFLTFVLQFIAPDADNKALVFMLLGVIFNLNAIPVNSGWALAAARMARSGIMQRSAHWLNRATGCMFIGFGLKLAFSDNLSS